MADRSAALGAGTLVNPHGHMTRLLYECSVIRRPVAVIGEASVSFGPRWSGKRDRTSACSAAVSGSETGTGPGYVSEQGDSPGPSTVPHLNDELRFRSIPMLGIEHAPMLVSVFLRCR